MAHNLPLTIAAVVAAGVAGQWLAWHLRLPSILVLLGVGILAGPVTGLLAPDARFGELLPPVVSLSVAVILFEGGLGLDRKTMRQGGRDVWLLVTVGGALTWGAVVLAARLVLRLDLGICFLLGAILMVTGPTVIGPMLDQLRPSGRVGPILRAEGVIIDPIGAIAAVLTFEAVRSGEGSRAAGDIVLGLLKTAAVGSAVGLVAAALLVAALRRYLVPDHLHAVVTLGVVLLAAASADALADQAGLLAATVAGFGLAQQRAIPVPHVAEFKENLRVLLIGALFVTLAARLSIDQLVGVGWRGVVFVLILVVVARPLVVAASTVRSGLDLRERAFLASLAPRGIVAASVSSVFALQLAADAPDRDALVPTTFAVVIGTILLYAVITPLAGRRLGLVDVERRGVLVVGAGRPARAMADALRDRDVPVLVADADRAAVNRARLDGHRVFYGSVLSDEAKEHLELHGIGAVLAMTPNDELNSLATLRFVPQVGRGGVYQITPTHAGDRRRRSVPRELEARRFEADLTYERLDELLEAGHVVRATPLTDRFGLDTFRAEHPRAVPLFVIRPGRRVVVLAGDERITPGPGDMLLHLAPPLATGQAV
jgi:NhaP-type Na+/H+ or K+/H+ antiporter